MPDIGPQFESTDEKKDKPEKAGLESPADEAPESVKEGNGATEKSDIEKLKAQETYEETYTIEIEGEEYEIPVEVSYFEYPKEIQEDTGGVLGYERRRVSRKKLGKLSQKTSYTLEDNLPGGEDAEINTGIQNLLEKLLNQITDENFPGQTSNHAMNRYRTSVRFGLDPFREKLKEKHYEQKASAQKVLDPNSLERLFRNTDERPPLTSFLDLSFIRVRDNKLVDLIKLSEFFDEGKIKEWIESIEKYKQENEIFAAGCQGLSLSNKGSIWKDQKAVASEFLSSPIYGFSHNNSAFINYLEKVQNVINKDPKGKFERDGFSRKETQKKSIKYFLEKQQRKDFRRFDDIDHTQDHPWVPVIQGHPDVPDLRWCHAEYGYIPTENNLNVLRFISEDVDEEDEVVDGSQQDSS